MKLLAPSNLFEYHYSAVITSLSLLWASAYHAFTEKLCRVIFALLRLQNSFPSLEFAKTKLCLKRDNKIIRIHPVLISSADNKGENKMGENISLHKVITNCLTYLLLMHHAIFHIKVIFCWYEKLFLGVALCVVSHPIGNFNDHMKCTCNSRKLPGHLTSMK